MLRYPQIGSGSLLDGWKEGEIFLNTHSQAYADTEACLYIENYI